jgi:prepilin-type N-terminal cleavage/methylation domain-containing protein
MTAGKALQRGFTLVEIVVVVAIIGILTAITLVSLSNARDKGYNAAIQSDLSTVQVQAQLYLSDHGNYGTDFAVGSLACPTSGTYMFAVDVQMKNAIADAKSAAGGASTAVKCYSNGGTGSYAVQASLRGAGINGKTYWCVDSAGSAIPTNTALTSIVSPAQCAP